MNNKVLYNIYFGTIGKTLGIKYRFTTLCDNENEANKIAQKEAELLYYKNEGRYGIPTIFDIDSEAKLTGVSTETLVKEHIKDLCRWYAIPTKVDSVTKKQLKYK